MIPGYKIIGLKVNESAVFKPHQTYMELNHHKIIPLKGALWLDYNLFYKK